MFADGLTTNRYRVENVGSYPFTESIVIPNDSQPVEVAQIGGGPGFDWRHFYTPKVIPVTAWFVVDGEGFENRIWSDSTDHGIVGEWEIKGLRGDMLEITDNGDGTAAFDVIARESRLYSVVTYDEIDGYVEDHGWEVSDVPITGMTKADFAVEQSIDGGARLLGDILRVRELADPGTYRVTWSHENGTHLGIMLLGRHPVHDAGEAPNMPFIVGHDVITSTVTISTLNQTLDPILNPTTNKYESTLEYAETGVTITFTSDTDFDATINLRQKASTARPLPDDPVPAGLYYDINVKKSSGKPNNNKI